MKANLVISWLTGILTLLLATFSFVLSFNALTDLAKQHGVSIPPLFPFTVEAAVIVFSLNALYRSLSGEQARKQWSLIIGSSLLAGLFNIAHAQADLISRAMAAMPSLFLLLSFESFLGQVKHAVKRSTLIRSIEELESELNQKRSSFDSKLERMRSTLRQRFEQERSRLKAELEQISSALNSQRSELEQMLEQVERLTVQKVELERSIVEQKKDKKAVQYDVLNSINAEKLNDKQQALNALLSFYRSNPNASLGEAAQAIERSKGTVSNYLNELEQAGLIHRNGNGIEVTK